MDEQLIAPCGMNCGICKMYLREKKNCPGCRLRAMSHYCRKCIIRLCEKRAGYYCFTCAEFPCQRLKSLDKRYREKYDMSEMRNLTHIRDKGIESFLEEENRKWACSKCDGVVSCHTGECFKCGAKTC